MIFIKFFSVRLRRTQNSDPPFFQRWAMTSLWPCILFCNALCAPISLVVPRTPHSYKLELVFLTRQLPSYLSCFLDCREAVKNAWFLRRAARGFWCRCIPSDLGDDVSLRPWLDLFALDSSSTCIERRRLLPSPLLAWLNTADDVVDIIVGKDEAELVVLAVLVVVKREEEGKLSAGAAGGGVLKKELRRRCVLCFVEEFCWAFCCARKLTALMWWVFLKLGVHVGLIPLDAKVFISLRMSSGFCTKKRRSGGGGYIGEEEERWGGMKKKCISFLVMQCRTRVKQIINLQGKEHDREYTHLRWQASRLERIVPRGVQQASHWRRVFQDSLENESLQLDNVNRFVRWIVCNRTMISRCWLELKDKCNDLPYLWIFKVNAIFKFLADCCAWRERMWYEYTGSSGAAEKKKKKKRQRQQQATIKIKNKKHCF